MKRNFAVLALLLFFVTTGVCAKDKTSIGGQIAYPLYPGIFIDVPVTDLSSIRLGVGSMWGFAVAVDAKYRRRFGGSDASYYWEVGALNISEVNFFGLNLPDSGTGAQISLGARFSKGKRGAWFISLGILSGVGGTTVVPNIGYEFLP